MRVSLNGDGWSVTGWNRHQWKFYKTMETNGLSRPAVPTVPARVPGAVQTDLLRAGVIQDWKDGQNFFHIEWLEHREWVYERRFILPEKAAGKRYWLCFEGLDFYGHVLVNDVPVLSFDQMYLPYEVEVTDYLRFPENQLRIVFLQPPEVDGQVGYTSKTTILKSRFNYGWDWMPRLVNIGIFDDVFLRSGDTALLQSVYPRTSVRLPGGDLDVAVTLRALREGCVRLKCALYDGSELCACAERDVTLSGEGDVQVEEHLPIPHIRLWHVLGTGDQTLYTLRVWIEDGGQLLDDWTGKVGFRTLEFRQTEDAPRGSLPYAVYVNGDWVPLKGLNWVPLSPFYGSVTREDYRYYLDHVRQMNVNLLRVWGGAPEETETFYQLCDEMGILVWQEFPQSSSGIDNAPCEEPDFIRLLAKVAESYVRRRRHHACLAVWCAGNELYTEGYKPVTEANPNVSALAEVVKRLVPERLFLPDSPSGETAQWRADMPDQVPCGDTHGPWLYEGVQGHYSRFNADSSQLHSEVGAPACPREETLRRYAAKDIWPFDENNPFWLNRGSWWIYNDELVDMFGPFRRESEGLSAYVRAFRYIQMEALRYAATSIRRAGRRKSGLIVWMANEPFPNSANTSVLEYDGCPKPAFYKLQAAFAKASLGLCYDTPALRSDEEASVTLYGFCDKQAVLHGVKAQVYDLWGNLLLQEEYGNVCIHYAADIAAFRIPAVPPLVIVRLSAEVDDEICEEYIFTVDGKTPFGTLLEAPEAAVTARRMTAERFCLTNEGKAAALHLDCIGKDENGRPLIVHNNYRCLLPGESLEVYTQAPCAALSVEAMNDAGFIQEAPYLRDYVQIG